MVTENRHRFSQLLAAIFASLVAGVMASGAMAQTETPAPGSAYFTDSQSTSTSELVNNPIDLANTIICYFRETQIDGGADGQPYIGWVATDSCSNSLSQSDLVQGGESSKVYDIGRLVGERTADGLRGTAHFLLNDPDGDQGRSWGEVIASDTTSADSSFIAHTYIENGGSLLFSLRNAGDATVFLYENDDVDAEDDETGSGYVVRSPSTDSGRGFVEIDGTGYRFGYNAEYFCRLSGDTELCFDRRADRGWTSVWQYGLYELNGSPYVPEEPGEPGFGIKPVNASGTGWGWIDSSGVWLPQTDRSKTDTQVIDRDGNQYNLSLLPYRLEEYSERRTLEPLAIDSVPLHLWLPDNIGGTAEIYWDNDASNFKVVGYSPDNDGNFIDPGEKLNSQYSPAEMLALFNRTEPSTIHVWQPTAGIPAQLTFDNGIFENVKAGGISVVNVNSFSLPDDDNDGVKLYCFEQCTTASAIEKYESEVKAGVQDPAYPFNEGFQVYTAEFEPFQLKDSTGEVIQWPSDVGKNAPFAFGYSVELFTEDSVTQANIDNQTAPAKLRDYYFNLGFYDRSAVLTNEDGQVVNFAESVIVEYVVPESALNPGERNERYLGARMLLELEGDELRIPGTCYAVATNSPTDCGGADVEWYHDFFIPHQNGTRPDEAQLVVLDDEFNEVESILAKWRDREVAFLPVDIDSASENIELGTQSEFTRVLGDFSICNPSVEGSECYVGSFPADDVFDAEPAIIYDGENN
mgnify:FL=1